MVSPFSSRNVTESVCSVTFWFLHLCLHASETSWTLIREAFCCLFRMMVIFYCCSISMQIEDGASRKVLPHLVLMRPALPGLPEKKAH